MKAMQRHQPFQCLLGTHTLVGRWYWEGSLTVTRIIHVTVLP